jgi:hypothetical protein
VVGARRVLEEGLHAPRLLELLLGRLHHLHSVVGAGRRHAHRTRVLRVGVGRAPRATIVDVVVAPALGVALVVDVAAAAARAVVPLARALAAIAVPV